jgi:hypothetical protein
LFLHAEDQVSEVANLLLVAIGSCQLLVRARLDNLAILQDSDSRALFDSCQTMGNDDRRPVLHDVLESLLYQALRDLVESARSLVKKQDLGVAHDSTCDSYALFLAA